MATKFDDASAPGYWSKGSHEHYSLWVTYSIWNVFGSAACLMLIYGIVLLKTRTSADIYIAGLASGCAWMSLPCAIQCAMNMAHAEFAYGRTACEIEAIFHFAGILVQFMASVQLGIRNYLVIVHQKRVSERTAIISLIVAWVFAFAGTILSGYFSTIYLMPSGTYCWYKFNSPAFIFWFSPMMVICLLTAAWCYWRIFFGARKIFQAAKRMQVNPTFVMSSPKSPALLPPPQAGGALSPALRTSHAGMLRTGSSVGGAAAAAAVAATAPEAALTPGGGSAATAHLLEDASAGVLSSSDAASPLSSSSPAAALRVHSPHAARAFSPGSGGGSGDTGSPLSASPAFHHRTVSAGTVAAASARTLGTRAEHATLSPQQLQQQQQQRAKSLDEPLMRVARRSALFIVIFLFSFILAVIASIYELAVGPVAEGWDIAIAEIGCFHTLLVPLVYGYTNAAVRQVLQQRFPRLFCCLRSKKVSDAASRGSGGHGSGGHGSGGAATGAAWNVRAGAPGVVVVACEDSSVAAPPVGVSTAAGTHADHHSQYPRADSPVNPALSPLRRGAASPGFRAVPHHLHQPSPLVLSSHRMSLQPVAAPVAAANALPPPNPASPASPGGGLDGSAALATASLSRHRAPSAVLPTRASAEAAAATAAGGASSGSGSGGSAAGAHPAAAAAPRAASSQVAMSLISVNHADSASASVTQ